MHYLKNNVCLLYEIWYLEYKQFVYGRLPNDSLRRTINLAGVQEVRQDRDATEPAEEYTFFYEKVNVSNVWWIR